MPPPGRRDPALQPSASPFPHHSLWPTGRAETADKVLIGLLMATGAYGLALTPFAPSMLGPHPVLLEFLRGSTSAIILGGAHVRAGDASLPVVLFAGLVGCVMFDWLYWWAGARWGQPAIDLLLDGRPRTARLMVRLQAMMHRRGSWIVLVSYILPLPVTIIDVAAGWGGMSLRRFLLLDTLSALIWVSGMVGLGYAIGKPAVDVAKQISHYGLLIGIALIVIVMARQFWRQSRV